MRGAYGCASSAQCRFYGSNFGSLKAAEDRGAARTQHTHEVGGERDDRVRIDISDRQIAACRANRAGRADEGQWPARELDGDRIDVTGDRPARSEQLRGLGENTGTGADVEHCHSRLELALERLQTQLRGLMGACSERHAWVDPDA